MVEQFRKYVDNFDFTDNNIERKYYHSLRVKSLCQLIAKEEGFSNDDVKIAEVIGLLHDYGRFMQWTKYHTYKDFESIDHADYGVDELFKNNEISKYWTNEDDYDEIYDAIKYHNKISVPSDLSDHNKNFCKIVRDADKIDILYLFASKSLILPEDGEVSEKVKLSFDSNNLVDRKDEVTGADYTICTLAFVFDLNYKYSFNHLKKYNIIEQIYENVKDKDKFKYYFDKVIKYVNERSK